MRWVGRVVCVSALAVPALFGDRVAAQSGWRPIDPADLALAAPKIEKDADAEALLWDIRVADDVGLDVFYTEFSHYVRIKIFTDHGRDTQSRIDIPTITGITVSDIAGRTIKADGSILELKPSDIFERTIVKGRNLNVKAKSFALPGVEKGSIIEYRYKQRRLNSFAHDLRLGFQRDIPVHLARYHIKPIEGVPMHSHMFHGTLPPWVKEGGGFVATSMTDIPSFHEEPFAPPAYELQPWLLIYYTLDAVIQDPIEFWKTFGRSLADIYKVDFKPNDDLKRAAAPAAAAPDLDAKIAALLEVCRKVQRNDLDTSPAEVRAKTKRSGSPAETLKRGWGDGYEVNVLFGALAAAAGLDARIAAAGDREDVFVVPATLHTSLLPMRLVAIRAGEDWRIVDPSNQYSARGSLRWQQENEPVIVSGAKDPAVLRAPLSAADVSAKSRTAILRLQDDGTLEGDLRVELSGHFGIDAKEDDDDRAPAEREQTIRDLLTTRLPGAELSAIKIENVDSSKGNYVYATHVRVPGYAQRTGTRLFLQPAVFQRGVPPMFTAANRTYPLYFQYPWSEVDTVTIALPEGFELEQPEAPADLEIAGHADYKVTIELAAGGREVRYRRVFSFANGKRILFGPELYTPLKRFFDSIHDRDAHTLTVRRKTGDR